MSNIVLPIHVIVPISPNVFKIKGPFMIVLPTSLEAQIQHILYYFFISYIEFPSYFNGVFPPHGFSISLVVYLA